MKKSELKSGMVVATRSGQLGLVLQQDNPNDTLVVAERGGIDRVTGPTYRWDDDLNFSPNGTHPLDIVKVYDVVPELSSALDISNVTRRKLLFDREPDQEAEKNA